MDYKTLLNKLPAESELHYVNDCTQLFKENNLNINDYKKWNYMLFEYTIDSFDSTLKSLDKHNIDYTIKTDYLDLYYILIK